MSNLDNRVSNADHLLTQDVEKLCNSVGELYSNLSKVSHTLSFETLCRHFYLLMTFF